MDYKELILGCECLDVGHIARFVYFDPIKGKEDPEGNVIYMCVPTRNYYNSFSFFYFWGFDFEYFFRFNFLKRFYYAYQHLTSSQKLMSKWKEGVLDAFDFRNEDINRLSDYLDVLSKNSQNGSFSSLLKEGHTQDFDICFYVDKVIDEEGFPYVLRYSVIFHSGNIWERFKTSLKYIFGYNLHSIEIELNKNDVEILKTMILSIKQKNTEEIGEDWDKKFTEQ